MTLAEFIASPFAVAALALSGALGSQLITARANLKNKRLELAYARKADAYKAFLVALSNYAHARRNAGDAEELYRVFLESLMQTGLVASKEVHNILNSRDLSNLLVEFRTIETLSPEVYSFFLSTLNQRTAKLELAMRADLHRLGGL